MAFHHLPRRALRSLQIVAGLLVFGGVAGAGCSVITGGDIGKGLGSACKEDSECQGSTCVSGVCTKECTSDAQCPEGITCQTATKTCGGLPIGASCTDQSDCSTKNCTGELCTKTCTSDGECPEPSRCFGNLCQLPLSVGYIWVGVVEDQGWTLTHDLGRKYAKEKLPYLTDDFVTNIFLPETAADSVKKFKDDGRQVIVANSFSLRAPIESAATDNPDIDFLVCSGNSSKPNLGSYFARSYQDWYLAGFAAASKSKTHRLGFVGSFVTPEVVRHIDAFTLGAKKADPTVVVEVRWEGFWFDLDPAVGGKFRETVLTEELLATGCDVITHNSDNSRSVEAVEKAHNNGEMVWSIGNDNVDACDYGPNSCLGVPYWNWGPLYVRIFEEMHKHKWDPTQIINDNIKSDQDESINYFGLNANPAVVDNNLRIIVGDLRGSLTKDPGFAFNGPYDVSDPLQRPAGSIAAGTTVSDDELTKMCWFVEGVVEKVDPTDPLSADKPARVPWGDVEIPPGSGVKPDCRQNQ